MHDLAGLGRTMREVRRDLGMTQQELADKLGISNMAISQIENAKHAPALSRLVEIADELGVSLAVLFGDPLATAEYIIRDARRRVRALGYDLALIPREDA